MFSNFIVNEILSVRVWVPLYDAVELYSFAKQMK